MWTVTNERTGASVQVNGPALRFVRETRGLSGARLARAVGVSTSFVAAVERGVRRGVRAEVFVALVRELGLLDPRAVLARPYEGTIGVLISDTPNKWANTGPEVVPSREQDQQDRAA